jgi:serine/threonine-protein kinase
MSTLPSVGEVIAGKYRIEGLLGEGGMAHVFAAHHELLDKSIAVKILSPTAPNAAMQKMFTDRFLTEARAAAKVDSPHVARVMDCGTLDNGVPFMVMERLDGCDLEELLRLEHNLAVPDAVDYVLQALQGLAHAHSLGIIHRDLKPANLFLSHQPDGAAVIKIVDFGIAKVVDLGGGTEGRITGDNSAVGSPMYMSPEQVRNAKAVDHRADIWAMGVVLYELLAGSPPFGGDDLGIGEIFAAVLDKSPAPLRKKRAEVPSELEDAVMKCLEKDPEKRYADVSQLARDIAPFGSGKWTHVVDAIEQSFRSRLQRLSGTSGQIEIPPALLRRAAAAAASASARTETASTLDNLRPPTRSPRWRIALAIAAVLGVCGIGWGVHAHVFDGLLSRPAPASVLPASPRTDSVPASDTASGSAAASAAASVAGAASVSASASVSVSASAKKAVPKVLPKAKPKTNRPAPL